MLICDSKPPRQVPTLCDCDYVCTDAWNNSLLHSQHSPFLLVLWPQLGFYVLRGVVLPSSNFPFCQSNNHLHIRQPYSAGSASNCLLYPGALGSQHFWHCWNGWPWDWNPSALTWQWPKYSPSLNGTKWCEMDMEISWCSRGAFNLTVTPLEITARRLPTVKPWRKTPVILVNPIYNRNSSICSSTVSDGYCYTVEVICGFCFQEPNWMISPISPRLE